MPVVKSRRRRRSPSTTLSRSLSYSSISSDERIIYRRSRKSASPKRTTAAKHSKRTLSKRKVKRTSPQPSTSRVADDSIHEPIRTNTPPKIKVAASELRPHQQETREYLKEYEITLTDVLQFPAQIDSTAHPLPGDHLVIKYIHDHTKRTTLFTCVPIPISYLYEPAENVAYIPEFFAFPHLRPVIYDQPSTPANDVSVEIDRKGSRLARRDCPINASEQEEDLRHSLEVNRECREAKRALRIAQKKKRRTLSRHAVELSRRERERDAAAMARAIARYESTRPPSYYVAITSSSEEGDYT